MPTKLFYKIGEACKELDIQPYVLRYWETEFPVLAPSKSKSGQRVYSEQDLSMIRRIKELLYEEGYTIAGAKKKLDGEIENGGPAVAAVREPEPDPEPKTAPRVVKRPAKKPAAKRSAAPKAASKPAATGEKSQAEVAALRKSLKSALDEARKILEILDSD